jgi:hypothetical protein
MATLWPSGLTAGDFAAGGGLYNLGEILWDRDVCGTQKRTTVYIPETTYNAVSGYRATAINMTLPSYVTSGSQFDLVIAAGIITTAFGAGTATGKITVYLSGTFSGITAIGPSQSYTYTGSQNTSGFASGLNSLTLTLGCPSNSWGNSSGSIALIVTNSGTNIQSKLHTKNLGANFGYGYRQA